MAVVALGSELVVNAIAAGNQYRPSITRLASGGFAIAWQDESGLGSPDLSDDVRFARFDAFGARLNAGIDTVANTVNLGAQFESTIAAFGDGKFVIAWTDASEASPDFDNRAIRLQIFNENGSKSGAEVVVNTTFSLSQDQPSIAVLSNGNIVVTWTSEDVNASSTTNIIRRVFNSTGSPVTGEQVVNTQVSDDQERSTVHALSTGGFAVVWEDRLNVAPSGFFEYRTFIRLYDANGAALAAPVMLNSASANDPQQTGFAELSNGNIVVVWTETDPTAPPGDGSGHSIRARIFNPSLSVAGAVITVNTTTSFDQTDAQVAALDGGQFVVVWSDLNTSGDDSSFGAVRLQVFDASGAKVGSEIRVNQQTLFEQANPVVTVLADGRFVVAWEDRSQLVGDTQGFAIHSRIFDARIAGINLDGNGGNNDFQGSNFGDTINGLGGNDRINGGGGIDFLFGGFGDDTLNGESGNDQMDGGGGNDAYYVDSASDVIIEAAGPAGGIDFIYSSVTFQMAANCERLYLTGAGNNNATGRNGQNDVLIGNNGANVLDGLTGYDIMRGGLGNDIYYVDHAADTTDEVTGGGGTDFVYTTVSFTAAQGIERLILLGSGNINATGRAAQNDILIGNSGNNILNGLSGVDVMRGGLGNDTYYVDNTGDTTDEVTGGGGIGDYVYSSVSFTAAQGIERIYLTGSAAINGTGRNGQNDIITGNTGINTLNGLTGNDVLTGGLGSDTLTGGAGLDIFRFDAALGAANMDTVTDFIAADDTMQLENAIFALLGVTGTLAAGLFKDLALGAQDANDVIIYNRATGALFYDSNGLTAGGQTQFADLTNGLIITNSDFVVI